MSVELKVVTKMTEPYLQELTIHSELTAMRYIT